MRRLLAAVGLVVVLAACGPPLDEQTHLPKPQVGAPMPITLPVQPGCSFGEKHTWKVTLPNDGTVPPTAYYAVEDDFGMTHAALLYAGNTVAIVRQFVPWRLMLLGPDLVFHPITGWIVNVPGQCV